MNEQRTYLYTIEHYDEESQQYDKPVIYHVAATWRMEVQRVRKAGSKCRACRWKRDDVADTRRPKKRRTRHGS